MPRACKTNKFCFFFPFLMIPQVFSVPLILFCCIAIAFFFGGMNGTNDESILVAEFVYHPEVARALENGLPVVALESTIISHGMPYPQNIQTAKEVEQVIRSNGAIPATIAIINQKVHIGLTEENLELLGKTGLDAHKTSRRDVAYVLSLPGAIGATTVSGTMLLAHRAHISVFVTGGIGGVHRGATETLDISADLTELGRTPVTVVCAGVKSILDIQLTLEYLETQGVTVIGYQTSKLPAFFVRESDYDVHVRMDDPTSIARLIKENHQLQLNSGILVTCPIPEEFSADPEIVKSAIDTALIDAANQGVKGKDITPFLLDAINKKTQGKSLHSNIRLVMNNAKIGAQIAVQYAQQQK